MQKSEPAQITKNAPGRAAGVGYGPGAAAVAHWAQRLGPRARPRWGLVWSGNLLHHHDLRRSLAFDDLWAALPRGVDYVALQPELRDSDRQAMQTPGLCWLGPELRDFADTAALCDLLDGVITADTSVAHLAGALGRPTHLLLPHVPDWRWLLDRGDSPWYPSLRLHRQGPERRWDPVLQALAPVIASVRDNI